MRRIALYIACNILGLLPVRMLSAQSGHVHNGKGASPAVVQLPVVVKATIDKQSILIGQPLQLMLEATVPGGAAGTGFGWPDLDSLPHFEWVEKGKVDSTSRGDGRYYRQYLTLTSFDSGAWSIPRLPFVAGNKKYLTDSIRIEVAYTRLDPSKDYHDIKDVIDVPNPFAKWIPWIVGGITVVSLALVVWLIRKKKIFRTLISETRVPRLTPFDEATKDLDELERGPLIENGSVKEYYTKLNTIFRTYLFRRLQISSLAETSEELIGQLRRVPAASGHFAHVSETLRMSDFVKFAKYQPELSGSKHDFDVIKDAIGAIEKIMKENEAELVETADIKKT